MQVMPPRSARSSAPGALPGRRARRKAQRLVEHGRGGRQHTLSSGPGALTFGSLKVLPGRNGTLPSLGTRGGRRGRARREAGAEEACVSNGRSGHGAASRRQQRGRDARAPAAWRAPIAAAPHPWLEIEVDGRDMAGAACHSAAQGPPPACPVGRRGCSHAAGRPSRAHSDALAMWRAGATPSVS